MLSVLGGVFLGWSLGANDASNVFGSAVGSRMLRFRSAAILASIFVIIGAVVEGEAGINTLKELTTFPLLSDATISSVGAALAVALMSFLGLPVSTSQAVVGAIAGIGIMHHRLSFAGFGKILGCWLTTPLGGLIFAICLHKPMANYYNRLRLNPFESDIVLRAGLVIVGSYGSYTLGANNVANTTAVFVAAGKLSVFAASVIGGVSIAFGILTFSHRVMKTVGKKLVKLDPFSAFIVVLAEAITVHIYTWIGVPVSTSQAVIGALLGVGIIKGVRTVSWKVLWQILSGWFFTPLLGGGFTIAIYVLSNLHYIPPH